MLRASPSKKIREILERKKLKQKISESTDGHCDIIVNDLIDDDGGTKVDDNETTDATDQENTDGNVLYYIYIEQWTKKIDVYWNCALL